VIWKRVRRKRVRRKRVTREELHIRRKRRAQRNHLQRSVLLDVAKEESQVVKRLKSRSAKPKLNPKRNLADIRRAANKRNKLNV
jgi:hypothetical protein